MTKAFKQIKKKLYFKVFPYLLNIVVSNDVHQSREKTFHEPTDESLRHAAALHTSNGGGNSWIFLRYDARPGVIAHEAKHCVDSLIKFIHAGHDEEVEAYLLTYIIDNITQFIEEKWS